MSNFTEWLTSQYERMCDGYRMALHMEIEHTKKIYGDPLPDDVKAHLTASLSDIKVPEMERWTGERTGTMEIFNNTRKPNYAAILQEAKQSIQ
jgi:hypothetical protein